MFSKELKEYTADAHVALERKMIPHLRNISSVPDYVRLLDFMLGYYEPLTNLLQQHMPDQLTHSPAANLKKDIKQLDPSHKRSGITAAELPEVKSATAALGVLYVVEGSTLGGQIITKMIAKQIGSSGDEGFSFYNPYGEETGHRWNSFKELLNQPFTEQEKQEISNSAHQTFQTLNNWISNYARNNEG